MKTGDYAELRMKKALCKRDILKEQVHVCKVLQWDAEKESLFLVLESGELQDISLDAIYECKSYTDETQTVCTGRVRERYCGEEGAVLQFKIENGFYKISIKSVDKQIV